MGYSCSDPFRITRKRAGTSIRSAGGIPRSEISKLKHFKIHQVQNN